MGSIIKDSERDSCVAPPAVDQYGSRLCVLCLDEALADQRILSNLLAENWPNEVDFIACETGQQALELTQNPFDFVIFDLDSIDGVHSDAERAIGILLERFSPALLLAYAKSGSVTAAVSAMRAGAHDFLPKPLSGTKLVQRMQALQECMQANQMKARANEKSAEALSTPAIDSSSEGEAVEASLVASFETESMAFDFEGFIGRSPQMRAVYDQIERIAPSGAPVFITGESGTGKEVCAQALHTRSGRGDAPMIAINCGAIPKDLMEAEVFGAARGAYTGAHEDRIGAAEQADGGTLFLDEIGELDMSLQAKLLRFLQTNTINRIGEAVPRTLNVRIICATNHKPVEMIQRGHFRQDLFYRLHVLPIHLPPLRQRPEDILPMARRFLVHSSQTEGRAFTTFSEKSERLLQSHDWPGNVRELQNLIHRAVVMSDGQILTHKMLQLDLVAKFGAGQLGAAQFDAAQNVAALGEYRRMPNPVVEGFANPANRIEPMWMQEKKIIEEAMALLGGNAAKAAAALEISPSTIYRKKQYWEEKGAA